MPCPAIDTNDTRAMLTPPGMIKYTEFIAAALEDTMVNSTEQLEAAFHRLDLGNSGALGVSELQTLLGTTDYDSDLIQQILTAADQDGSGTINMEEFKGAIRGASKENTRRKSVSPGFGSGIEPTSLAHLKDVAAKAVAKAAANEPSGSDAFNQKGNRASRGSIYDGFEDAPGFDGFGASFNSSGKSAGRKDSIRGFGDSAPELRGKGDPASEAEA